MHPGHRTLAMIRQGFNVRGFLSQELTAMNYSQEIIFDRQNKRKKTASTRDSMTCIDKERIVNWDSEKEFVIDPVLIGSVIEAHLKKADAAPVEGKAKGTVVRNK
jgi:hypothetical protein